MHITVDWDQTRIADQVIVVQIGNLTKLTISDTGLPIKKVELNLDEEFISECLCDSERSFGIKYFAFNKVKEHTLHAICRPSITPEQVNMPLKQIVRRAKPFCEEYLEDVAIFLSEVAVTQYDQTTLKCECVLFSDGESNDDLTIQVDLKKQ